MNNRLLPETVRNIDHSFTYIRHQNVYRGLAHGASSAQWGWGGLEDNTDELTYSESNKKEIRNILYKNYGT